MHGWSPQLRSVTWPGLRVLLATQDNPSAPVGASSIQALAQIGLRRVRPITEILASAGMLDDDREPALDTWFIRRAADLPELIAAEFRIWFDVL